MVAWATCFDPTFNLASESSPASLTHKSDDKWSGTFEVATAPQVCYAGRLTWTWHIKAASLTSQDSSSHRILICFPSGGSQLTINEERRKLLPVPAIREVLFGQIGTTNPAPPSPHNDQEDQIRDGKLANKLADWVSTQMAGLGKDATDGQRLAKLIAPQALQGGIGGYDIPVDFQKLWDIDQQPKRGTLADWNDTERLLYFKQGSCGNWAHLFQAAAKKAGVKVELNGFDAVIYSTDQFKTWTPYNWGIGFQTLPLGHVNKSYIFGDHQWCEYGPNSTVYDPSFGVTFPPPGQQLPQGQKAWIVYIVTALMDQNNVYFLDPVANPGIVAGTWSSWGTWTGAKPKRLTAKVNFALNPPSYAFATNEDKTGQPGFILKCDPPK